MKRELSEMTAVILAGGLGTRLRPVVSDRPKVLAEVEGRPFLAYLLDQTAAAGMRKVVLCTGHLGDQVRGVFGERYKGIHLVYSQERELLGTAGALRLALSRVDSEHVLVMNGDSFCSTDLNAFWQWHHEIDARATILLAEVSDTKRSGRVKVDGMGRVVEFIEKYGKGEPGWINAGIYLIHREWLEAIPANQVVSLEREVFPAWIGKGFYGYFDAGPFIDIGIPETYASAKEFFIAVR